MIGYLKGRIIRKQVPSVLIDVGGVGYEIFMSINSFSRLPGDGSDIGLDIYTHVRENEITLYGFHDLEEKRAFEMLLTVSGVGARLAMGILSGVTPPELFSAIYRGDVARLTRAQGVGKKIAERVIVELKDRVGARGLDVAALLSPEMRSLSSDLSSALSNLGYRKDEIERVMRKLEIGEGAELEGLLKEALRLLDIKA